MVSSSRPWRKSGRPAVDSNFQEPLIPTDILDVGTQRNIVFSLFILIQSFKCYELVFPKSTYSNEMFAIKYLFIDGLFLWILPIFRVPWLCFSSMTNIFFTALFFAFNIMISRQGVATGALFMALLKGLFQSEYTLSGTRASHSDLDDASFFHGQYMVKILPESTAIMNPFEEKFCIDDKFNTFVYIPFVFNSTDPNNLILSKIDFEGVQTDLHFQGKDIKRLKTSDAVPDSATDHFSFGSSAAFAAVKISETGIYRLLQVADAEGVSSKVFSSDLIIPRCPSASFETKQEGNKCLGDIDSTIITVVGIPPLKLEYSRLVLGRESMHSIESVQPENFASPLFSGGLPQQLSSSMDFTWAKPQEIEVAIDAPLNSVGEWIYNIDQVQDGLGNVIAFDKLFEKRGKLYPASSPSDIFSSLVVHPRPQIRYSGCDSQHPLVMPLGSALSLPLDIVGDASNGPYEAVMEFKKLENGEVSENGEVFSHVFEHKGSKLVVNRPGAYSLVSVKGKFCTGNVIEPSNCLVYVPPVPRVNAEFVPIEDKCAGPIGVQADLTFVGTPPFSISYRVFKDNKLIDVRHTSIREARHQLKFNPESAGTYTYEFFDLKDSVYQSQDYCEERIFTQLEIRALASASFRNSNRKKCCAGDSVSFDLELSGLPPFKLAYEIIGSSRRSPEVITDIQELTYRIDVPKLNEGGKYAVSLVSIEDSRGCRTLLKEEANIEVRRQRPQAGFLAIDGEYSVKTHQNGHVDLPLRLTGEGPWNVEFDHSANGETVRKEVVLKSAKDTIQVGDEGIYTLVRVSDAYCPGEVASSKEFSVSWYEKPKVSLIQSETLVSVKKNVYQRSPVCQSGEDSLRLQLQGYPPFTLTYDVTGPIKMSNQKVTVATKYANIKLLTSKSGLYTYTFKGISDAFYSLKDGEADQFSIQQEIRDLPSVSFKKKGQSIKACSQLRESGTVDTGIPIKLKGTAPFIVKLSIFSESTGRTTEKSIAGIESDTYTITSVFQDLQLGRHIIRFDSVSDSVGCQRTDFPNDEVVHIIAAELPKADVADLKTDLCVGERIMVPLSGVSPFEITYEFNGKLQKAKTDSHFSRVASSPGTLMLKSLGDSASSCMLNIEEFAKPITIHQKPSVEIDEKLSKQVIREGDEANLVFAFTGTPPFSFTYTRSEMVGKPLRKKIMETHSVSNIQGHHYTIKTHTQGFYEAIAVEDNFCSAKLMK